MGVLSEINRLVKQAQLIMPPVYKPEVYRKGADNIVKAVKKLPNAAWGTIGVGAGLAKGVTDRAFGNGAEGSWGDYVRAGWDAGYNHGDMAAAGMIEGAANAIPFAKFEAPTRFADFVRDQKVQNGMDADVADTMRGRANYAGVGVAMLPTMAAWGALGKGFGAAGGAITKATGGTAANIARGAAQAQKWGPRLVLAGQEVPSVNRAVEAGIDTSFAKSNAELADRELNEEIGKMSPDMAKRLRSYVMDNYDAALAGSAGISEDDYRKQFVGRSANKFRVLNAPEADRPGLMKQYGFDDAGMAKFKNRFDAMSSILNAPEENRAELMRRNGLYDDEIGLMLDAIDSM